MKKLRYALKIITLFVSLYGMVACSADRLTEPTLVEMKGGGDMYRSMHSWVGRSTAELVDAWGGPENSFTTGHKKYVVWKYKEFYDEETYHCTWTFETSQNDIIISWRTEGNYCKPRTPAPKRNPRNQNIL